MNWWQKLREDATAARLAGPTDRPVLADLLSHAWRRHGSLAVEEQAGLLNSGVSTLLFNHDQPLGFLGLRVREQMPGESESWAEAAMIIIASGVVPGRALAALLEAAAPALRGHGATGVVCLAADGWLIEALREADFREHDQVITYVRNNRLPPPPIAPAATLRHAGAAEADTVLTINAAAFDSLWRYDSATTLSWLLTADHTVLAEREGRPVGFALTSHSLGNGYDQLIRLATHPSAQGLGVGRQLVADAIAFSRGIGAPGLALNTQASNTVSRHLYEALDFRVVGAPVHVMTHSILAAPPAHGSNNAHP
jgi:ribosomal protein S18 acetylase RimI-like enzyme